MKKYRYLMPVAMIVVMVISWYMLINARIDAGAEYNNYLQLAREKAEEGIVKQALMYYTEVLDIKKSPDIYIEIIEFLATHKEEQKKYLLWCENFFEDYPTDARSYNYLLSIYVQDENYADCYELFDVASKRNVTSDYIDEVKESIKYKYEIDYSSYDDVGIFSNNLCKVCSDDYWGFVNRYGTMKIDCCFKEVGVYTQSGLAPVINQSGEAFFIDMEGDQATPIKEQYKEYGMYVEGLIAAKRADGKYEYIDSEYNPVLTEYDYASTFNYDIAAVRIQDKWKLIDSEGKSINDNEYVDIKLDDKDIAFRNERAFVAIEENKYIMIDGGGNQIGSLEFEDAMVFNGDYPTTVKISGKWHFISKEGKLISDKEYSEARAFSNGIAAVCIGDKWGFIDENEEVVIEPQFYGARDFTEKGSCFVDVGGSWRLLKLYRLNR